jgi:hypothetical protein
MNGLPGLATRLEFKDGIINGTLIRVAQRLDHDVDV